MFCKKCGNKIKYGESFCTRCGYPTDDSGFNSDNNFSSQPPRKTINYDFSYLASHLKYPATFFEKFSSGNLVMHGSILTVIFSVLYGILNLVLTNTFISSLAESFKDLAFNMLKSNPYYSNAAYSKKEISRETNEMKVMLSSYVDYRGMFSASFFQFLVLIALTFIVLYIGNHLFIYNKIKTNQIFFLSAASYFPMILSILAACIIGHASIFAAGLIIFFGLVWSFITIQNGIKIYSQESDNTCFKIMVFFGICFTIIVSIIISLRLQSIYTSFFKFMNIINNF